MVTMPEMEAEIDDAGLTAFCEAHVVPDFETGVLDIAQASGVGEELLAYLRELVVGPRLLVLADDQLISVHLHGLVLLGRCRALGGCACHDAPSLAQVA